MAIPAEHKEQVIGTGIEFMRSITECYGADKGMELWDQVCSVLDPSVKGEVFFAMITGQYNHNLVVSGKVNDRVASIKTIRTYTGLGLKEAKDLSDIMQEGRSATLKLVNPKARVQAISDLRKVGHVC